MNPLQARYGRPCPPVDDTSGVLRCCRDTVWQQAPVHTTEGDTLDCEGCGAELVFQYGRWRFRQEPSSVPQAMRDETARRRTWMKGLLEDRDESQ